MKIFDRFKAAVQEQTADDATAEVIEESVDSAVAEEFAAEADAAGSDAAESGADPAEEDVAGDSDVRIADERYEAIRAELAAAREEMRRRELEYFALTLLAEEKMSPKLCAMVRGETEEEISRNVEAVRIAVRDEVQRLRGSSAGAPPVAGKGTVSASAIKKLSLRELKNIMG